MKERISEVVFRAVAEFNEGLDSKLDLKLRDATPLFGENGKLDSLQLVSLVIAVEQCVNDELGKSISLADEKALSLTRSPFRTLGTLVDYVTSLV